MKNKRALFWIILLTGLLALLAASMGLFYQSPGAPIPYQNERGEAVVLNNQGLYRFDTVSSAAQMQANDLVTLVLGLPLLAVSTWLAFKGSLRARLLLAGTLGFFLYTYLSMSMNTAYNALFLVYVALFSLSLYGFILTMLSFDLEDLPNHFASGLPRRWIAGLLFAAALFLAFAWIGGRILPTLTQNQPPALDNTTTMVIQAMDLGLVAPLAVLSGLLLLRRSAWGYLLASVAVMKFITMGIAVSAMGINMALKGVQDSLPLVGIFMILTLANLALAVLLLKNINDRKDALPI